MAGIDYEAINEILVFSECEEKKCFDVTIYGDDKVRPERSFNLKLDLITDTENELLVFPDTAMVNISDISSELDC